MPNIPMTFQAFLIFISERSALCLAVTARVRPSNAGWNVPKGTDGWLIGVVVTAVARASQSYKNLSAAVTSP
jgi:hypothetical protein